LLRGVSEGITTVRMTPRRDYRKPPLIQAVCEIRFIPTRPWDWTIPGLLYDKIKGEFPEKKLQNSMEIKVGPQQDAFAVSQMQFLKPDQSAMVQVGPDVLAVHSFLPYVGWEGFSQLITRISHLYQEITGPSGISRLGLRYINRITFAPKTIETEDYFNLYARIPNTIEQTHGPFSLGILFPYADGRDMLNVRMGNTVPDGIVLDLDYYTDKPKAVELNHLTEWANLAHDRIEIMFEACITDRTRELFDVQKESK
jgi:uncharacterized protein (TIGR04255 family)